MRALASARYAHAVAGDGMPLIRIQRVLASLSNGVGHVLVAACAVLLAVMIGTVFLEVVIRYVVRAPLPWTEELARFSLGWFGMLSAAAAANKGLHFSFRWAVLALGGTARRAVHLAVTLLATGLLSLLFVESYKFLDVVANQTAMATELDMRIPYAGLPVGIGALLLINILEAVDSILGFWTGQRVSLRNEIETQFLLDTAVDGV